jgi:heat shock protein HslJ
MKYIILLLLTAFTFVACESDSKQHKDQNYQPEATTSIFEINWVLIELNGEPVTETEISQSIPTIQFDATENRFYGRGGCNQYNGGFEFDSETGEVELSQIAATKMACPDMDLENRFFTMLNEVERIEQSSQILKFFNDSGETIAQFEVMEN